MSEDLKRQWYVQNEDEVVAGSFESGDVFWRIADCHTPEIAQRVCELHNASLPEHPLLTAVKATEKARAQYEEARHQKPLDTNKELRAWLELMTVLLNQRDLLQKLPGERKAGDK